MTLPLVNLEVNLVPFFEPIAEVDGHDIGSGEMKFFVLSAEPVATFEQAEPLLFDASLLYNFGVAYRGLGSDNFTVLWPKGSTERFVVA